MIDSLARATGAGGVTVLNGRTYRLAPLSLRDFGLIEAKLRRDQESPLEIALRSTAGVDDESRQSALTEAYKDARKADVIEHWRVEEFLSTSAGAAFGLWISLMTWHRGEWDLEQLESLAGDLESDKPAEFESLKRDLEIANGLDPIGAIIADVGGDGEVSWMQLVTRLARGNQCPPESVANASFYQAQIMGMDDKAMERFTSPTATGSPAEIKSLIHNRRKAIAHHQRRAIAHYKARVAAAEGQGP